jgi:large subunit ribosomal protein L12
MLSKIKWREEIKMEYIYAALLLHKAGKEVNEANLKSVIAAAGLEADDAKIKSLIASLNGVDIDKELESASLVSAAPSAGLAPAEAKKEEAPKEEKKEAAAEGLSALFG